MYRDDRARRSIFGRLLAYIRRQFGFGAYRPNTYVGTESKTTPDASSRTLHGFTTEDDTHFLLTRPPRR
jgi:hypothetical protein